MWPLLALAGMKMIGDTGKESRQRKLASETQRYSPWTNLQANPIQEADPLGTAMQTYGTIEAGKAGEADKAGKLKLQNAQVDYLNTLNGQAKQSPWFSGAY